MDLKWRRFHLFKYITVNDRFPENKAMDTNNRKSF